MTGIFAAVHEGAAGAERVVLVHGSLDRSSAFLRVQRLLEDLTVVRYDRRGYAKSIEVGACTSFDEQVDDLAEVVGGRPSIVAGHSLGGVIALAYAQRSPGRVRAVVSYESPMPWLPGWPSGTAGSAAMASATEAGVAAERFMRRMIGDDRWESLPERTKEQRRQEGPALVAELRSIRSPAPSPYDPAKITMPAVIGHGTRSRPHHQEAAGRLADVLPQGELVVIDGADHGVHLSDPAAFANLIRRAIHLASAP
ncbi:MAG: alpha/beta hydrolase [Acidimicrobiales bacterium]